MLILIISSGGLGHYGVLFAKALGAEVYALSHSPRKEADALAMGAKEFICTKDPDWYKKWAFTFDFMLNTANATHNFDIKAYMSTLRVNAAFHNVGLPEKPLPPMMAFDFMGGGYSISVSHIGSRPEMLAMLDLASKQNIKR